MEQELPPDWAIEEAIKRANHLGIWDVKFLKDRCKTNPAEVGPEMTILAARLIAQHEEPPVDPLVQIVRDIVADSWDAIGGHDDYAAFWREGAYDSDNQFSITMTALKRGIEIGKEQARGEG